MKYRVEINTDYENSFLQILSALSNPGMSRLFGDHVRALSRREIRTLKKQGNYCPDWGQLLVHRDFNPSQIRGSRFYGRCVLGLYKTGDDNERPETGIFDSTLISSEIGSGCLINRAAEVSSCCIMDSASVVRTALISCPQASSFGFGTKITVGSEAGLRSFTLWPGVSVSAAYALAETALSPPEKQELKKRIDEFVSKSAFPFGIVCPNAVIEDCGRIVSSFIGTGCKVSGAQLVENSSLLASEGACAEAHSGAVVKSSLLQPGSSAATHAVVENSALCSGAGASRHANIISSLLGPGTHASEGEINSSIVGPHTGFHHQALLISALWPAGRGNIGYGANVGSNHTGRAPDQEIICGEGQFFGLGCCVKFPANYSASPYSIIATGVTTQPQRVCFPFSLIAPPSRVDAAISPGLNELFPGWVFAKSPYTLFRSEKKFAERGDPSFSIFREDIVRLAVTARDALVNAGPSDFHTEKTISGAGRNYIAENSRLEGIKAYSKCIEYFCLNALFERLKTGAAFPDGSYAAELFSAEGFSKNSAADNLRRYSELLAEMARSAMSCKERDDVRGRGIIDSYGSAVIEAGSDAVIASFNSKTARFREEIEGLLQSIQ